DAVRHVVGGAAEDGVAIERNVRFERQDLLDELAFLVNGAERVVTPIVRVRPRRVRGSVVAVRACRGPGADRSRAIAERSGARVQRSVLVPVEVGAGDGAARSCSWRSPHDADRTRLVEDLVDGGPTRRVSRVGGEVWTRVDQLRRIGGPVA